MIYNNIEICCTNYNHPTITTGMHTNGPCTLWIRSLGGEWVCTYEKKRHIVTDAIDKLGQEVFEYYRLIEIDHRNFHEQQTKNS